MNEEKSLEERTLEELEKSSKLRKEIEERMQVAEKYMREKGRRDEH